MVLPRLRRRVQQASPGPGVCFCSEPLSPISRIFLDRRSRSGIPIARCPRVAIPMFSCRSCTSLLSLCFPCSFEVLGAHGPELSKEPSQLNVLGSSIAAWTGHAARHEQEGSQCLCHCKPDITLRCIKIEGCETGAPGWHVDGYQRALGATDATNEN